MKKNMKSQKDFYKTKNNNKMSEKKEDQERKDKFEEAVKPLMKYLSEYQHAHVTVVVSAMTAEMLEGMMVVKTDEFLID